MSDPRLGPMQPPGPMPPQTPPGPQMPQQPPPMFDDGLLYDCKIKRTNRTGKICIEAIPPEEFLVERRAVSNDSLTFAAHRTSRTKSELIEMGFDKAKVNALPSNGDALELNPEKINRFKPEDDLSYQSSTNLDPSMDKVWVAECYLKVDYNGDSVAEWRKVTVAGEGNDLLDNEECDGHPFDSWSPYLQPHKLIGESVADKTIDIQLWKSTVVREMNDGMYFNNAPQLIVVEGQTNMEDVLTRRPGGVIRVQNPAAVTPLPVVDTSQSCMAAISYIDSVKETRTGVRRFSSGIEADALNPYASTATGAKLVDDSSKDTIQLIARNYAEMLLKSLCQRAAELIAKYQDKKSTVKLRGKWVDIDPSSWSDEMDCTVTVGLGTGNKDSTVMHLVQMLTQVDAPLAQLQGGLTGPILTEKNVYNKLTKLVEAQGFKSADDFYTDPSTAPPKPPQPDPKMAEVQGKLELQKQMGAQTMQLKQQQAQLDAQNERDKAAREANTEAAQAQADMATDRMHAENQLALERQKTMLENQREEMRLQHEMAIERTRMHHELEINRIKTHADIQAKTAMAKAAAKNKPKVKA